MKQPERLHNHAYIPDRGGAVEEDPNDGRGSRPPQARYVPAAHPLPPDHHNKRRFRSAAPSLKFSDPQYLNILESLGQSVHVMDSHDRILYWNRGAENLFGYSAEEALGQCSIKLIVDIRDRGTAYNIVHRVNLWERWTGMFPLKNKSGQRFTIIVTSSPFYDDAGTIIGLVSTCVDTQAFRDMRVPMSAEKQPQHDLSFNSRGASVTTKLGADPQQPLRKVVSSKLTNLASMMSNKLK